MNGEDTREENPEWRKKFSNVFFLDESILEFLPKKGAYCLPLSNTAA